MDPASHLQRKSLSIKPFQSLNNAEEEEEEEEEAKIPSCGKTMRALSNGEEKMLWKA